MSDQHEKIDFSQAPRLEVRPELFEEMLARRQARSEAKSELSSTVSALAHSANASAKVISLPQAKKHWKMPMAIAASLLCVAGAIFFVLESNPTTRLPAQASTATSSFSTALKPSSSTTAETTEDALTETVDWYGSLGEGGSSEQLVVADAIFQSF